MLGYVMGVHFVLMKMGLPLMNMFIVIGDVGDIVMVITMAMYLQLQYMISLEWGILQ